MKTLNDYLQDQGGENFLFNSAIYNKFSVASDREYASMCGGFREGVFTWVDHNIDSVVEVANSKYEGWILYFSSGSIGRVYIPHWVLNLNTTNLKHAKCLFNKYLKVKQG